MDSENLKLFVSDANEVVNFHLVSDEKEFDRITDDEGFHPEFSHQFFGENESIFGYSDLSVNIFYAKCTLEAHVKVDFSSKLDKQVAADLAIDDIIGTIAKQLPNGCLQQNVDKFRGTLQRQAEFKPFGQLQHSYSVAKDGPVREFQIYKVDNASDQFVQHFERIETFALWFIDAASFLDTSDSRWHYYIIYEKSKTGGDTLYSFVGYASVYHYYAFPEHKRPRIGHIMVLPPFQKCGHGVHLLQTIYRDLIPDKIVLDITAEDPSDHFIRLRNFVDCLNASQLHTFTPENLRTGLSEAMIEEAQRRLKIPKKQIRRVYEILRLKHTDMSNPDEAKRYRLEIKNRLNIPYQKNKRDFAKLRKSLTSDELTATLANQTAEQRLLQLQRSYEETVDEYRHTINRLAGSNADDAIVIPNVATGTNGVH